MNQKIIDQFARLSPIAWTHIIFTGKYNFKKSGGSIDLDSMVNALKQHLKNTSGGSFREPEQEG